MKSNELRIGNLVETDFSEGNIKTVVEIKHKMASVKYIRTDTNEPHQSMVDYERLVPIKLTEEWLKKAGYKKQNGYGYSNYNVYGTILKNDNGFEFHYYGIIIRLDFVHQLQNLFFSLYGEDLVFCNCP